MHSGQLHEFEDLRFSPTFGTVRMLVEKVSSGQYLRPVQVGYELHVDRGPDLLSLHFFRVSPFSWQRLQRAVWCAEGQSYEKHGLFGIGFLSRPRSHFFFKIPGQNFIRPTENAQENIADIILAASL